MFPRNVMLIMLKLSTHSFFLDDEIGINCVSRGNSIHEHGEKAESSINITVLYTGQVLASLVGRSSLFYYYSRKYFKDVL